MAHNSEGVSDPGHGLWASEFNLLASDTNWAWPLALRRIFQPRGVNLLVAQKASQFLDILCRKRIHTAIMDSDSDLFSGLTTIKMVRMEYPLTPCILLSRQTGDALPTAIEFMRSLK